MSPREPEKSAIDWYLEPWRKYAVFSGRARRKQYWYFYLFNFIIFLMLGAIEGFLGIASETEQSVLAGMYQLAVLIPSISVGVRRMHDTNHSGWWLFFPLVNLAFLLTEGQRGDNRFGPDPKVVEPPIIDKELLTNYDILAMVEIQLGVGVIVSKIRDTRSDFALSSSDLITLKQQGVSETVIEAMLESQAKQTHDH